jgi:hypothetical protein
MKTAAIVEFEGPFFLTLDPHSNFQIPHNPLLSAST